MTDDQRRIPIKVKVVDKRKTNADRASGDGTSSEAPSAHLRQTVSKPAVREGASSSEGQTPPSVDAGFDFDEDASPSEGDASPAAVEAENLEDQGRDYLQDLLRVQAEFDNFRKRTFRERQQAEAQGKQRLIEHLLPVLDNFELAIAHGEGGAGVELVFKELKSSLEREGLAEIPAEGEVFDPQVHEAVESVEDPSVEQATVTKVYRRGYRFGDEVVRPAMVVVARPAESLGESEVAEGGA